jgi:protein tyrosine phosphatase (PTP) superfamily phosphohydrolase (DUF442 family)
MQTSSSLSRQTPVLPSPSRGAGALRALLPGMLLALAVGCGAPGQPTPSPDTRPLGNADPAAPSDTDGAGGASTVDRIESPTLVALELPGMRNVHAMNGLVLAGQPNPAGLQAVHDLGGKSVLNSRTQAEMDKAGFDERSVVEGLGMTYEYLPWNGPDQLSDEILDRTRAFLRDAPRPALYHCASANRVGAAWIAYRVLDEGLGFDEALAEGRLVGLRTEDYVGKVRDYVARQQGAAR